MSCSKGRSILLTGSEVPLLSFAARSRAYKYINQLHLQSPLQAILEVRSTLSTTTLSINPFALSWLPSAPAEGFFILPLGFGLELREWFALCVPPPVYDFSRFGSVMRTMVTIYAGCGQLSTGTAACQAVQMHWKQSRRWAWYLLCGCGADGLCLAGRVLVVGSKGL